MSLTRNLAAILERLYAVEVNVTIQSFFDLGYTAKFGDTLNGWLADEEMIAEDLEDLAEQLHLAAARLFPEYRVKFTDGARTL